MDKCEPDKPEESAHSPFVDEVYKFAATHFAELDQKRKGFISSDDLDRVKICPESRISVGTVVTVENLTSFHRFCQERAMVIYLAGYHNEVKRKLLKEIYTVIPDVPYRHFGDIDCGGFKIWENLRERTEIPFEPMRMGIAELKAYGAFGRQLSETDRKEIRKMLLCPAYAEAVPVLGFMLSHNLKLEQECIV